MASENATPSLRCNACAKDILSNSKAVAASCYHIFCGCSNTEYGDRAELAGRKLIYAYTTAMRVLGQGHVSHQRVCCCGTCGATVCMQVPIAHNS